MKRENIARIIVFTISWAAIIIIAVALVATAMSSIGSCFTTYFEDCALTAPIVAKVIIISDKATIAIVALIQKSLPYIVRGLITILDVILLIILIWAVKVFFARPKKTKKAKKTQKKEENLPAAGEIDH